MKLKGKARARIKNQFILSVGDEGAILTHFQDGKLANKLFVDSPVSPDVKLMERLLTAYPRLPVYMLVDVIEQNYSQQVLPPVSSFSIKAQINRRLKRDFQPNDLNNVLPLGRNKEGRKDWNFLFISLANTAPFSKWLEIALSYKNKFGGVYLVPVEAMKFGGDLEKVTPGQDKTEWELFVFHNKISGLRIVALKNGKLAFTRLAQNLVGDNIAEIIVGNMEQEISNTVEYLKRLGFKGEASSKISIISSVEILQKIDPKALKFGIVDILTPFQAAEKLGINNVIADKDKFADVLIAAHFASVKKHVIKFSSKFLKDLETLQIAAKAVMAVTAILVLAMIGYSGYNIYDITQQRQAKAGEEIKLLQSKQKLQDILAKKDKLPKSIDKMMEILEISKMLPKDKFKSLRVLKAAAPLFEGDKKLKTISYSEAVPSDSDDKTPKPAPFELELSFDFAIPENQQDRMDSIANNFLDDLKKLLPQDKDKKDLKVDYNVAPKIAGSSLEQVLDQNEAAQKIFTVPASIKISGTME